MKKIAFIGFDFHNTTTKSSLFFIDILKKNFEVNLFWDFANNPEDKSNKNAFLDDYYILIFWQVMPNIIKLQYSKCQNIIIIPMYEQVVDYPNQYFEQYNLYRFICFSKVLYNKLVSLDINSLYVQYYPKPYKNSNIINQTNKVNIFFWKRGGVINLELIKKLIPKQNINSICIHSLESEKYTWFSMPNKKDIQDYNITFSSWFDTHDNFVNHLQKYEIFIVPRLYEGIGMTFLEAMNLGRCVVSPNTATMNEYIKNQQNGILFDLNNPKNIDLSNLTNISKNSMTTIYNGYQAWQQDINKIVDFLNIDYNALNNYNRTMDLESSYIFSKNLNFIHKSLNRYIDQEVIIYGAGTGAQLIQNILPNIIFFVDLDQTKHNQFINNIPIYHPKKLLEYKDKMVIISVFGRENKIIDYLINKLKFPLSNIDVPEILM
jgi:hypothetical protein